MKKQPKPPKQSRWQAFIRLMPTITMPKRASLIVVLGFGMITLCFLSSLLGKLGINALFYADGAGFMAALTDPVPGGLLRYIGQGIMSLLWGGVFISQWMTSVGVLGTLGLLVATWLLYAWLFVRPPTEPTECTPCKKSSIWTTASLYATLPIIFLLCYLWHLGFSVWLIRDTAFFILHILETAIIVGVCLWYRHTGKLLPITAVGIILYPFIGISGLIAGCLISIAHAIRVRRWILASSMSILCLATPAIYATQYATYDLTLQTVYTANTFFLFGEATFWWNTFGIGILLSMIAGLMIERFPVRIYIKAIPFALVIAIFFASKESPVGSNDYKVIIEAERLANTGNYAQIANLEPRRPIFFNEGKMHRMLVAYNILGMFYTDRLDTDLFCLPIAKSHMGTSIETIKMDGYYLLFHYGLLNSARRVCYEEIITKGFSPERLSILARCALLSLEFPLAEKYLSQLVRCPFRGKEVARLRSYMVDFTPDKLSPMLHHIFVINQRLKADPGNPTFSMEKSLESLIYRRYALTKQGDEQTIKMYFAASLLIRQPKILVDNLAALQTIYPAPQALPSVFAQGLLAGMSQIEPAKQPKLRPGFVTPEYYKTFVTFQEDAKVFNDIKEPSDEQLAPYTKRYGKTYLFYERHIP